MVERTRIPKPPKPIEPLEEQIGQDGLVEFEESDPRSEETEAILVKPDQEPIEDPVAKEKLADLAFMEEKLSIHIHDTAERDADPRFEISVNGIPFFFERGKQYDNVPRYIVEGLARAKPVHYANEEYDENGEKGTRWPSRTGLRYGFSVIRDPHPRGGDWLRSVLAQP